MTTPRREARIAGSTGDSRTALPEWMRREVVIGEWVEPHEEPPANWAFDRALWLRVTADGRHSRARREWAEANGLTWRELCAALEPREPAVAPLTGAGGRRRVTSPRATRGADREETP